MRIYPGTTVDYEFKQLGDLGYTGTLNDRQFAALRAEGLTGSLPDMFGQFTTIPDFSVIIASGTVAADLTDFPVVIDLSLMPTSFWADLDYGGENLRAYAADGTTRLPMDIITCLNDSKAGSVAVKVDVAASADTEIILRASAGGARVAPSDTYGRNAVWSDYKAVLAGGQDFQNRTGLSLARAWEYPSGFETVSTSPTVIGHEGVIGDGSTFVVIGSNALRKYNSDLDTVLDSNLDPAGDAGGTECGGGCYHDGKIYVTTASPQKIAVFDYATLDFIEAFDISATGTAAGGLEVNPEDGLIYTIVYDSTSPYPLQMLKYDPADGSYHGSVTLTTQSGGGLRTAQGMIWYRGAFYVPIDDFDRYYRVTPEGVVTEGGEFETALGTPEDGFSFGDDLYHFRATGVEQGVVVRRRPNIFGLGGGVEIASGVDGRITMPITTGTTWTMRATGRRLDTTTRVLAALHEGGSGSTNVVNMAWISGSGLRAGFDSSNSALNFASIPAPDSSTDFMMHLAYDGTAARHGWYNGGAKVTDATITARGSTLDFAIFGSERETVGTLGWRGRLGLCYVRAGVLSDAWIAAEYANWSNPSGFYTITEI